MQDRERLRVVNKSTIEEKLQQGNSRTNSQRNYDLTREKFEERNGNRREKKVDMENGRDVSGKFSSAPEIEIKINLSSPSKSKSKSKTPSNVAHAHNLYKPAHVPKPEKTNHEKKTNDIRLQNDLKRLELKLRNMTKVNMMSTETRGEATRDKYSHYPQMRPMSANVQAIEKIELDIKLLRRKLRKGGGGEEEEKEREKEERERGKNCIFSVDLMKKDRLSEADFATLIEELEKNPCNIELRAAISTLLKKLKNAQHQSIGASSVEEEEEEEEDEVVDFSDSSNENRLMFIIEKDGTKRVALLVSAMSKTGKLKEKLATDWAGPMQEEWMRKLINVGIANWPSQEQAKEAIWRAC